MELEQVIESVVADEAEIAAAYGWGDGVLKGNVLARLDELVEADLVDEAEVDRLVALYGEVTV